MLLISSVPVISKPIVAVVVDVIPSDPSALTAADALKISSRRSTYKGETECHRLMTAIQYAACCGNRSASFGTISAGGVTLLASLGYTVVKTSQTAFTISW